MSSREAEYHLRDVRAVRLPYFGQTTALVAYSGDLDRLFHLNVTALRRVGAVGFITPRVTFRQRPRRSGPLLAPRFTEKPPVGQTPLRSGPAPRWLVP